MRNVKEVDDEVLIRHMSPRPWAAIREDVSYTVDMKAVEEWTKFHQILRAGSMWASERQRPLFLIDEESGAVGQVESTARDFFRWKDEHREEFDHLWATLHHDFYSADQFLLKTEQS